MKRKEAVYKGLQFNSVWFEDKSLTSPNYFQITEFPTRLTSGKNLFKFRGHPNNLQAGSYLDIEVLDYNGDPIYHEVINYIDEDKSRVIVIYIYTETSPGDCTITMLGEAKNVPAEWRGRPNIKWTRSVPVNPNISNVSEIIFEMAPDLIITEQIGPHLDRIYSGSQFPTFNGTARYFSYNGQPAVELLSGNFTNDMSTGTITVSAPANPAPISQYTIPTTAYSSTVKKILSPTLALLDTEYTVYSSQSISSHTYQKFDESAFSLTYEATPQYVTTQNSESFALVQINNLEPASGDVNRVKLFMNNKGTVGTWELINDVELTETEIFVTSTSSLFPDQSIGTIVTQSTIDTYWEGHTYQGKTETTAPTLTWITSSLQNAMRIQNAVDISNKNTISVAQIKSAYKGIFLADSEYKVTLDALGTKTGTEDAVLSVYISGSAFSYNTTDYFNQEFPITLGKRIGELRVNTNTQRFDDKIFSFETSNDGTGVLILVVESGNWQVADIRTTSDNDSGYSPNYTRIRTLVPTAHKSDNQISFKAEYYSITGEKSKQISYVYNKTWEGGNRYIDGNYSMITGSLYVADSLESGVAISGYKNTGYIRSLGYNGFNAGNPGFLLWSGSALPGSTTTYQGVGLELYADTNNYFRYRTDPSELIVKTEKFFLGSTSPANFISGSNGNLEISSSNFHLDAAGNVTASYGEYRGTNLADLYKFRVLTINTTNSSSLLSTYTNGGNTYYCLNLTGSYDPSITGTGPAMFIRIGINLLYPIAAIAIHPDDWSVSKYQRYATYITLEAGVDFYITENITPPLTTTPDSEIKVDLDDIIHPGFHNRAVNGTTYANTLKVDSGTRVFLAQSAFDWKIQSITSFTSIPPFFPTGSVTNGTVTINGTCNIDDILILQRRTTTPSSPTEGMIIASGSAGSSVLYYYNGTTWNSLF